MIEYSPIEPALFNDQMAASYLLLNGDEPGAAKAAMNRLVDSGKIRPAVIGGKRRYSRLELDRFIAQETENYG